MKILFASSSSGSRGGGELFLIYLAEALARHGHEVALWTASHVRMDELAAKFGQIGPVLRADYINTYDHRTRLLATCLNIGKARRIGGQWTQWRPDIVHVNKQNLEDGLDLLRAANGSRLPAICTIHITQSARFLKARMARLRDFVSRIELARFKGKLVAVQGIRGKELARFLGKRSTNVIAIPNGVRIPPVEALNSMRQAKRTELVLNGTQNLVLGLGRMVPQKRPATFLSLAEQIHRQNPKTQFLWVGDGAWGNQWDKMVGERKMGGYAKRIPWQAEPLPFLAAADLFLHTAEFEGLPFALLEAMAAHLPCAMSTGLAKELAIQDRKAFIPVEDVGELINTLEDDNRLDAIAGRGHELVQKHYSVERMAEEYEKLYLQTLALNHAG